MPSEWHFKRWVISSACTTSHYCDLPYIDTVWIFKHRQQQCQQLVIDMSTQRWPLAQCHYPAPLVSPQNAVVDSKSACRLRHWLWRLYHERPRQRLSMLSFPFSMWPCSMHSELHTKFWLAAWRPREGQGGLEQRVGGRFAACAAFRGSLWPLAF